ncbi:Short spindle protein 4 [Fasciola gigantica]|uniref:Short spindle protein 4 n=1 Tax=Fasciola gigantica TaxID=46835 RepID=A0A504YRL5_FASGI|nr:Short spindle protein 4 [Fasciola gigantica]
MAASIAKLAPPDLVKQTIIGLSEREISGSLAQISTTDPQQSDEQPSADSKTLTCPRSPSSLTNGSISTGDLLECRQWLQRWLDAVVAQTLPKVLSPSHSSPDRIQELIPTLGFSTRLACAIRHYSPSLSGTDSKIFEVCLDRYRAALLDGRKDLTAKALGEDDLANGQNIYRLLRTQLISTNNCPIRSFHLIEQLSVNPHTRNLTPAQEVRLSAEFYHWLSSPVETHASVAEEPSPEPFIGRPAVPDSATSSSSLQNGILRNLVRSSGVVARPARPAHPNSRPIALLNTSTVEQLVVSSSSDAVSKPPDTVVREAETTSETPESHPPCVTNSSFPSLPMTSEREATDALLADLARVASNAIAAASVDSQQSVGPDPVTNNPRPAGGFFVNPNNRPVDSDLASTTIPVDSSPLTRSKFYATFSKRPTPSLSDKLPIIGSPTRKQTSDTVGIRPGIFTRSTNFSSPQHAPSSALASGIPSLRSEFEKKRRSRSTASANQSVGSDFSVAQKIGDLPRGITTWATSGGTRQSARKASAPDSTADGVISSTMDGTGSKLPVSRSATAALRLSLDQRRRAIEVGRQRTMLANHQAAKQRHHAAFQKLLQTEQRRRSKKEEPEVSAMDAGSAVQAFESSADHVISSSAGEPVDEDSSNQMNGFGPYNADQSAVSLPQRDQVTDVDEGFSTHLMDKTDDGTPNPLKLPDQFTCQDSEVVVNQSSRSETGQDVPLIDSAITPDILVPLSSKEASPSAFESTLSKHKSDEVLFSEPRVPTTTHSSESSPQPLEQDHSSSEAMEYVGSVASERPIRSVSPSSRDWYNSMPVRHRSKGDPYAANVIRQSYSGRLQHPMQDVRHSVDPMAIRIKGSDHPGRTVPQRRLAGPSLNQSPITTKQRQFLYSAVGPSTTSGRRYESTSQSFCFEPRSRTDRPHAQLVPQQQHQRLRTSRRGRPHPLTVSEDYSWSTGMTRSVDQEWDEPGDDEYDDEVDDAKYENGPENGDELVCTNGIGGDRRYSVINDEYGDEQDIDRDYDNRGGRHRDDLMVLYDAARGSVTDSEEEEEEDARGTSGLRRSSSHRLWRDVDRFSSERSSIAFSSSGRRPTRSGGYRKHNQLRASYDPSALSHIRGFRQTEAVVDAETLDRLNRNLLDLQSGLERLSAQQQQVLLASSSATAAVALVAGANSQQAFLSQQALTTPTSAVSNQPFQPPQVTVQPSSPAGYTRAMWIERPPFRELSQTQLNVTQAQLNSDEQIEMVRADNTSISAAGSTGRSESSEPLGKSQSIQDSNGLPSTTEAVQAFFVDLNTHQASPSPTEPRAPEAPALESTPPPAMDKSAEPTNKSPTSKVFFIGFDEPDPQLMQRKCDRLEARRAAEKAMAAQQLEALRSSGREEKHSQELADLERKNTEKERREAILQAYLNRKEQPAEAQCHRHQNPYPVRPGSAALSLSSGNLSTKARRSASQNTPSKTTQRCADLRASRVSSLRAKSATRKQPPIESSTASVRGNADGEAVESNEVDVEVKHEKRMTRAAEASQKQRQRPNGRPTGRLTSGLSLSSLHRLGASDQSTSGPGVSVAGQPKLFVKPKAKSNRMVIVNAIGHCCLAGAVNEPMKQATLKELASTEGTHFMILFRDSRCQYRAVYAYDLESEELHLICGTGPRKITHDMANRFFKYNSGGKHFTEITSTNHLSPVVDAITIHDYLWSKSGAQSAAMSLVSGRPAP